MAGKALVIIVSIFLLFGVFFDQINDGVKSWRSDPASENFLVTTGATATAANVTLSYDLYQAALAEISSIVSNNTTDTPVAVAYDETTKHLTIDGLAVAITRTIAVHYTAETTDVSMRKIGPFLIFIIIGGCLVFLFMVAKNKKER